MIFEFHRLRACSTNRKPALSITEYILGYEEIYVVPPMTFLFHQ